MEEKILKEVVQETKQEVNKEETGIFGWLKFRYKDITDDTLNLEVPIPSQFNDILSKNVKKFFNTYECVEDLETNDIIHLNIYSSPTFNNYIAEKYPYFKEFDLINITWTSTNLSITLPMEVRNFMLYLCENSHNFNWVCNLFVKSVCYELFKLTILSDYLTGDLSAEEEEIFKICEKEYLNNSGMLPRGFEHLAQFKTGVFMNMFYHGDENFEDRIFEPADFLDKHWYSDFLYNRLKNEEHGEALMYFHDNTFFNTRYEIGKVYHMFYNVNKNTISKLDKDVKDYQLEHSKRLMFLVEICHEILEYWTKLREETAKKFKIDNIRKVDIQIVNMEYLKDYTLRGYKEYNGNKTFDKYMDVKETFFKSEAVTNYVINNDGNVSIKVLYSISQTIDSIMYDFTDLSKDEIINNIHITLRHEMGHVVDDCMRIDKNGLDIAMFTATQHQKLAQKIKREYDNTPKENRLDHIYWYYTFLPMERRANELMGLTIEDMYRADNTPIPNSIKELLKKD